MATFVRFETPYHCARSCQPLGIFWAAAAVRERAELHDWSREWLIDRSFWFGSHLPVPRFPDIDQRAIFWFRPQSKIVSEIWHLVAVLREKEFLLECGGLEYRAGLFTAMTFRLPPFRLAMGGVHASDDWWN